MPQQPIEVEHRRQAIRGCVYLPEAAGKRVSAVLFLHGFTGNRIEAGFAFVQTARALAARGIAAVTFDFRNSGESDGSFDQMLVSGELADALRMTEWLQGQPFVDRSRLAILGFSLGGLLAACTTARSAAFRALALWAPSTAENLSNNVCKRSNDCPAGEPLIVGAYTMHKDFLKDLAQFDAVKDVTKRPRPTLLVQGTGDKAVTPAVSQKFVDAMMSASVPVVHHLIQDADHGFSTPTTRQELIGVTTQWLVKQLTS